MKIVVLFVIALQLIACSSSYEPGEKMLAYKKDMTIEQASKVLQERVWVNNLLPGICGSRGFWYDQNSEMLVHKDRIHMLAHKRGKQLKKQSQNFDEIVVFEKQYYEYNFEFNSVNNVFVYSDPALLPYFPGCNKKDLNEKYYIVDLFKDKLSNLKFIVMYDDFDVTMASLSILLPDKKVIIK